MVRTMRKWMSSAAEFISLDHAFSAPSAPDKKPEYQLGALYCADYSDVTAEQIRAAKNECADHIARSKVISVKSGL